MHDWLRTVVSRYRRSGLLVDTNVLILKFVGDLAPSLIPVFKPTQKYTVKDYQILRVLLRNFETVMTTPHVLAEVSNLAGKIDEDRRDLLFGEFAQGIQLLTECVIPARELAETPAFKQFGLTDVAISQVAQDGALVLTDDFKLAGYLSKHNIDVLNFNHLRLGFSI